MLTVRAVDCAPTRPGTGTQPQAPDSLFPGPTPATAAAAASPTDNAASRVLAVALADTAIRAGSQVEWQISSEPLQPSASLQLGKTGRVQYDLTVRRSDPKEYIVTGNIQLRAIGNSNTTVATPQVFTVGGAGGGGGSNDTSKATVACPGGSSQIIRVTAGSTLVCSYTLSTGSGMGRLRVVVERVQGGRVAGMVTRTNRYQWDAAKDPNGIGCAQVYMGSIVGQSLVPVNAPVTATAQGFGARFAEVTEAGGDVAAVSARDRLERGKTGEKATAQSVRVCGVTSFKVSTETKSDPNLRCRSYRVSGGLDKY